MDRRIIELYDEYTHTALGRRSFIARLTMLAGGTSAAYALLPILENNYAAAQQVAPDDPSLVAEHIDYRAPDGRIKAYLVRPNGVDKAPAVIVIHENRGLNPHIEDVARRVAKAGFLALAPDLLSPLGGTPGDEDRARAMIAELDETKTVANLRAAVLAAKAHPQSTGKVGAVGFCWGGGMTNRLAEAEPALDAAVAFYGPVPPLAKVADIHAPLLLHYAGLDTRINESVPAYRAALDKAGKDYAVYVYDGVDHAFHNDTNAARYNKEAATLAWQRTVDFLKRHLG